MQAPLPPDEKERLQSLQSYEILDTPQEREFDDIALLASHICGTPTAMVSLIAGHRQWFKAKVGVTASETSRDIAFCAHGILQSDVFVINDAQLDPRFASNPLVTDGPKIRFYAGAPLIMSDGHALGMLCVNDKVPRELGARQKIALQALSRQVVALLELRKSEAQLRESIQQLKQAEKSLVESDQRFHQLADNVSDVLWVASPDLREIHYLSPAYERVWGRSVKDAYLHPQEWTDAILPEHRERVLTALSRLTAGEPSVNMEFPISLPDASVRWILSRGFQVLDPAGTLIRITGVAKDITERKRAEQAQAQFVAIVEAATDMVGIADADGRCTYINRAGRNLLDLGPDEDISTRRVSEFHTPGDTFLREGISTALNAGAWRGESVLQSRRGRKIPVSQVLVAHKGADNKVAFISTIARDLSEQKRLEGRVFQSQKMETVGKLAGGIAHEFNSILTAIIGQSELLLGDLPPGSGLAKNANEINKAAVRAAALTRQLLAYGRKQILQPEILDLNQLIARMQGMIHHLMGNDVSTQIAPGADLRAAHADAGQIEQVIINMAINAREAMPNGGKLTLETANVSFEPESLGRASELKAGNYVMLAVTDTGVGMSEEIKARAFEPFFSTKSVGEGAGLGLSTCYGIVKQSGGHISAYSEVGRGATFKIYLPQVPRETNLVVPSCDSRDLPRGTETILLVEDEPALREMAETLLKRLGYTVWVAANGIEALTLKQKAIVGHIDLLFTDVAMPHMSGKELADRVQSLNPHTRILFTSAYTENAIVHQGVLDKGVALLQKPFTPSALAHKLRKVLDA